MARKRSPERDKAHALWKESGGTLPLKDIAAKLGVSPEQIRKWKHQDGWCAGRPKNKAAKDAKVTVTQNSNVTKKQAAQNSNVTQLKSNSKAKVAENYEVDFEFEIDIPEDAELTEKQRLFCLYYVKIFNATQAAIKAGYAKDSAHVTGHHLLRHPKIRDYIKKLKGHMAQELLIDAMDILQIYMKIACADKTDFATFGQREVPVMGPFGPIYEGEGDNKKPVTKIVNFVDLNESDSVDGTIITEVAQGKDGVKIKFADKMKALEKLEQYFDLLPDHHKRKVEETRLQLERDRLELERAKATGDTGPEADDGFMAALEGTATDTWAGFNDELTEEDNNSDNPSTDNPNIESQADHDDDSPGGDN